MIQGDRGGCWLLLESLNIFTTYWLQLLHTASSFSLPASFLLIFALTLNYTWSVFSLYRWRLYSRRWNWWWELDIIVLLSQLLSLLCSSSILWFLQLSRNSPVSPLNSNSLQARVSTGRSLPMRTSNWSTTDQDGWAWLMLAKTLMDPSSSSLLSRPRGLMDVTSCLGGCWKEWWVQ